MTLFLNYNFSTTRPHIWNLMLITFFRNTLQLLHQAYEFYLPAVTLSCLKIQKRIAVYTSWCVRKYNVRVNGGRTRGGKRRMVHRQWGVKARLMFTVNPWQGARNSRQFRCTTQCIATMVPWRCTDVRFQPSSLIYCTPMRIIFATFNITKTQNAWNPRLPLRSY